MIMPAVLGTIREYVLEKKVERGVWERMDSCICMAESLCCPPETIITVLICYTQKVNKKKKKKSKGMN